MVVFRSLAYQIAMNSHQIRFKFVRARPFATPPQPSQRYCGEFNENKTHNIDRIERAFANIDGKAQSRAQTNTHTRTRAYE